MKIGYARVSTADQNLDSQIDALEAAGCERIYREKASGKNTKRPELQRMMEALREGDVVVVTHLDRISRSTADLTKMLEDFKEAGIGFTALQDPVDTTSAVGQLIVEVIAAVNAFERRLLVERTQEGLSAARARGRKGGRPALDAKDVKKMLALYDSKEMSVAEVCEACGVSKTTLYRYVKERDGDGEKDGSGG